MPYTAVGKSLMLAPMHAAITHASLHTGAASTGNELPTGRVAISLLDEVDGELRSAASAEFEVPENTSVVSVGFWDSARGGSLLAWALLPESAKFWGRGVYVLDAFVLDLNAGDDQ